MKPFAAARRKGRVIAQDLKDGSSTRVEDPEDATPGKLKALLVLRPSAHSSTMQSQR